MHAFILKYKNSPKDCLNNSNSIIHSELLTLAHLVSRFACNTRVIVDASSNPPVSNVKSL